MFFNQTFLFSWRAKQGKTDACETILNIHRKEYSRRHDGSETLKSKKALELLGVPKRWLPSRKAFGKEDGSELRK